MIAGAADTNDDGELSEEELTALTVAQLKELASEKGITLTATTKAAIIAEILAALNPADPDDNANDPDDNAQGADPEGT